MSNDTQQPTTSDQPQATFGARLKSMREAKGFDRKDAAAQLRLTEKIIAMMEYERYPADMPITFIKGYLRAYGKLLQIPEHEVKKALAPIRPKPIVASSVSAAKKVPEPLTSGNYFMQFFTYLIIFTVLGLAGMWWYNHPTLTTTIADNQTIQPHLATPPEAPQATNAVVTNEPPKETVIVPPAPNQNIEQSQPATVANQTTAPSPTPDNQLAPQNNPAAQVLEAPKSNTDNQTLSLSEQTVKPTNNATTEETKNSASPSRLDDNTSVNQSPENADSNEDSVPSGSNED